MQALRLVILFSCIILGLLFSGSPASGYIHYPPVTLQNLCKISHQIRLLKIEKVNREKGVIFFEVAQSLKGEKSRFNAFKHVIRTDADGAEAILDWAQEGKTAIMFWFEGAVMSGDVIASGYVFIDGYCYSVDYYNEGKYWLMLRLEPNMSICYHGSVEQLRSTVTDILDGKEVKVLVKEPDAQEDGDKRRKEINELLKKSRPTVVVQSFPVFVVLIVVFVALLPLFSIFLRARVSCISVLLLTSTLGIVMSCLATEVVAKHNDDRIASLQHAALNGVGVGLLVGLLILAPRLFSSERKLLPQSPQTDS